MEALTTADLVRHYVDVRKRLEQPPRPLRIVPPPKIHPDDVFGPVVAPRQTIPTMRDICDEVCRFYNIGKLDFFSPRRFKSLVGPRQIAAWLCWKHTGQSSPAIGRFLKRDHTTVLYAHKRVERLLLIDSEVCAEIDAIKKRLEL